MSYLYNPNPVPIFNNAGQFASGALAYFYSGSTTTPLVVYQDAALTVPHTIPVVANIVGTFPPIYIPYGTYSVRITDADGAILYYAPGIDNPAPPSSGGGIVVTQSQIFQTGFPIMLFRTGQLDGFVRMNGRTLGSLASNATEYAADNAADLFSFLWQNLPDSIATVSGGRGASASSDFTANKTIVIPTMQGYLAAGVDDMGTTAANVIQVSGNVAVATGFAATTIAPVPANLAVGMNMIINGTAAGKIISISGTTVTLDTNWTGATGTFAFRASFFSDAQQVGANAGVQTIKLTTDQMPSHTHTVTDPGHHHGLNFNVAYAPGGGGAVSGGGAIGQTADATTGITLGNTGGGNPFDNLQPSRLFSWYLKL